MGEETDLKEKSDLFSATQIGNSDSVICYYIITAQFLLV